MLDTCSMHASVSRKSNHIEGHLDTKELHEIGTRCREILADASDKCLLISLCNSFLSMQLRREKDLLRESQAHNFELIRKLDAHTVSLSEAHAEDRAYIQKLERELLNCNQEIDYLQDQINSRDAEVHCLEKHVDILELKLVDMENLQQKFDMLSKELERSNLDREILIQELERKDLELQMSSLSIENLEESTSSVALDSQCEIECMKLDIMTMEQDYFETKKLKEEKIQEHVRLMCLVEELEVRFEEAQGIIDYLEKDNKELREQIESSETCAREFCEKIAVRVQEILNDERNSEVDLQLIPSDELGPKLVISKEMREILGPLLAKLATLHTLDTNLKKKTEKMSLQIHEYELEVKRLKEELRAEKLKAKDETEDLAQEMAELRYEMTCLLEEERKRRASIEQASLQRIAELEAQVHKEERNSSAVVKHLQ